MTASGDRVRWTREQAGLSRGQAARLLGVTVEWVTGIEHGTVTPKRGTAPGDGGHVRLLGGLAARRETTAERRERGVASFGNA